MSPSRKLSIREFFCSSAELRFDVPKSVLNLPAFLETLPGESPPTLEEGVTVGITTPPDQWSPEFYHLHMRILTKGDSYAFRVLVATSEGVEETPLSPGTPTTSAVMARLIPAMSDLSFSPNVVVTSIYRLPRDKWSIPFVLPFNLPIEARSTTQEQNLQSIRVAGVELEFSDQVSGLQRIFCSTARGPETFYVSLRLQYKTRTVKTLIPDSLHRALECLQSTVRPK